MQSVFLHYFLYCTDLAQVKLCWQDKHPCVIYFHPQDKCSYFQLHPIAHAGITFFSMSEYLRSISMFSIEKEKSIFYVILADICNCIICDPGKNKLITNWFLACLINCNKCARTPDLGTCKQHATSNRKLNPGWKYPQPLNPLCILDMSNWEERRTQNKLAC